MNFEIYVRKSKDNPDIEMWTTVSIRDFIQSATQIEKALSKASIEVEPDLKIDLSDGTDFYQGDVIRISFKSQELNQEEMAFLKSIVEDNLDIIFLDNEGNIVYGCKKIIVGVEPILIDQTKLVQIAGSKKGIENLIFYRIMPYGIKVSFPRNGFIYNNIIQDVFGIIH